MKAFVNALDNNRLVTFASNKVSKKTIARPEDEGSAFVDFVSMNIYADPKEFGDRLDTVHARYPTKPVFVSEFGKRTDPFSFDKAPDLTAPKIPDNVRDDYLRGCIAEARKRSAFVAGASVWTFNDYRSRYPGTAANGYRPWGVVEPNRQPRAAYFALRDEFAPATIGKIERANRILQTSVGARPDFPAYVLRDYKLRATLLDVTGNVLSNRTTELPTLQPGANYKARIEFDEADLNRAATVKIEVVRPTGFVAAEHTETMLKQ